MVMADNYSPWTTPDPINGSVGQVTPDGGNLAANGVNEQTPLGGNWKMQEIYNFYRSKGYSHDEASAQLRNTMPPTNAGGVRPSGNSSWSPLWDFLTNKQGPQGPGSAY